MNFFEVKVFKKTSESSIFNNEDLWKIYSKELSKQIKDLGWEIVWSTEHCKRGIIVKSILQLSEQKSYLHMEVMLKSIKKRIDLLLTSKKLFDEIVEIKKSSNPKVVNFDKKNNKINIIKKKDITKHIGHNERQLNVYVKALKKIKKIKVSTTIEFTDLVFAPVPFNDNNIKRVFKDSLNNLNKENKIGVCWISLKFKSKNKFGKNNESPIFKDFKNKKISEKKVSKIYAGVLATWLHHEIK